MEAFEVDASHTELSPEEEKETLQLCRRRLLPVCYLSALLAYLDRTNLSFAKLCVSNRTLYPGKRPTQRSHAPAHTLSTRL